jgi:hypothetical protein
LGPGEIVRYNDRVVINRMLRRTACGAAVVLAVAHFGCGDKSQRRQEIVGSAPAHPTPSATKTAEPAANPATPAAAPAAAEAPEPRLRGPTLAEWRPVFQAASTADASLPDGYTHLAVPTGLEVPIYARPGNRWPIGHARVGSRIPARPDTSSGCANGTWYQLSSGGYMCSSEAVHIVKPPVAKDLLTERDRTRVPALDQPTPYEHAQAADGTPLLTRLPNADEVAGVRDGNPARGLVQRTLRGANFLTLTRRVEAHGEVFHETLEGQFVLASALDPKPTPPMHGEHLGEKMKLPLAFAFRETELICLEGDSPGRCGTVEKHARFRATGEVERDGRTLVLVEDGLAAPREAVRIVDRTKRPSGVGKSDKWIHIDLTEQAMIAYEGDEPVFATLISSGRAGFHTPTGLWQIRRKYDTKTMRGQGETAPYEVQDVPWALYYDGNYAAHGAYWHNHFGTPRSHGCTNIPPADARWIYHWAGPEMPQGWYAMFHRLGTHVYVTGSTPPDEK